MNSWYKFFYRHSIQWYALIGVVSFIAMYHSLGSPALFQEGFSEAGDQLQNQALITMVGQTGPVANNLHLNWQNGINPWAQPQSGLFILTAAWFFSGWLGMTSMGAYAIIFALAGAINGMTSFFMLRSIAGRKLPLLTAALSFTIAGAGMFGVLKFQHFNVAAFYLIPLVLGIFFRLLKGQTQHLYALLFVVAFAAATAPLWWVFVALLFVAALVPFFIWGITGTAKRQLFAAAVSLAFGASIPVFLAIINRDSSVQETRSALDSNVYGGHLADFIAASPYLNLKFNFLSTGTSVELSQVGMVGAVTAGVALLILLAVKFPGSNRLSKRMLYAVTLVFLLMFLLGGLGNLQAALAVVAGTESPARVWARLTVIISLLGAAWSLIIVKTIAKRLVERRNLVRSIVAAGSLLLLVMWVADYRSATPTKILWSETEIPEISATRYISTNLSACPIAQLPADSTPISHIPWAQDWKYHNEFLYRGYIPYILAKDFYWSFGDASSARASVTAHLPVDVNDASLKQLASDGFCAVLFDKSLMKFVDDNAVELPGTHLSVSESPDYENDRYQVFVLK